MHKLYQRIELLGHRKLDYCCFISEQIKAEYIADFHPDTFAKATSLQSKYIVIPDLDDIQQKLKKDSNVAKELKERNEIRFMKKSSEWLAVDHKMVALKDSGNTCNKMGVSFSDFRWQPEFCSNKQYRYTQKLVHTLSRMF